MGKIRSKHFGQKRVVQTFRVSGGVGNLLERFQVGRDGLNCGSVNIQVYDNYMTALIKFIR